MLPTHKEEGKTCCPGSIVTPSPYHPSCYATDFWIFAILRILFVFLATVKSGVGGRRVFTVMVKMLHKVTKWIAIVYCRRFICEKNEEFVTRI